MTPSDIGILVLGYARPDLLNMVLQSLQQQDALNTTHVWIDGTSDLLEIQQRPEECLEVARRFPVACVRAHRGHLGNNKMLIDSLGDMNRQFERLIVLEDDCFPTRNAVRVFTEQLERLADDDSVFSVYGHPFLTPLEGERCTRFQGWGWATTRRKLTPILEQARDVFLLPEYQYLEYIKTNLTPDIVKRLDITPGRNVCNVLTAFYSWDACIALLTAIAGQVHCRTPERVIFNCGIGNESGHFPGGEHLLLPPLNMIPPGQAWAYF